MTFDPEANAAMWAHLPVDLRDCDVTAVQVVGPRSVRVTHRDGTSAVHDYEPEHFRNAFAPQRDPAVFATARVVDGAPQGLRPRGAARAADFAHTRASFTRTSHSRHVPGRSR